MNDWVLIYNCIDEHDCLCQNTFPMVEPIEQSAIWHVSSIAIVPKLIQKVVWTESSSTHLVWSKQEALPSKD